MSVEKEGFMNRILIFLYSLVSYGIFFASFLYAIGFTGNVWVSKSIDTLTSSDVTQAIITDLVLLSLFALQHSVMARPAFKKWWTQFIPQPIERSTYVLFSSLLLFLLYSQWQSIPEVVWQVNHPIGTLLLTGLFGFGWMTVLVSTFMIDHFELFGLRQGFQFFLNQPEPQTSFKTPGLYKWVRHPIMLGFIIGFWATPVMTWGHFLFAAVTTAYILVAIQLEERDLMSTFGSTYEHYKKQTGMLLPPLNSLQP